MRNLIALATCVLVIVLAAAAMLPADQREQQEDGVFSGLEVGQRVTLRDLGTAYQITVLAENLPLSHEVLDVGIDYIVVRDAAGVTETTIPAFALKAVIRLKLDHQAPGEAE